MLVQARPRNTVSVELPSQHALTQINNFHSRLWELGGDTNLKLKYSTQLILVDWGRSIALADELPKDHRIELLDVLNNSIRPTPSQLLSIIPDSVDYQKHDDPEQTLKHAYLAWQSSVLKEERNEAFKHSRFQQLTPFEVFQRIAMLRVLRRTHLTAATEYLKRGGNSIRDISHADVRPLSSKIPENEWKTFATEPFVPDELSPTDMIWLWESDLLNYYIPLGLDQNEPLRE